MSWLRRRLLLVSLLRWLRVTASSGRFDDDPQFITVNQQRVRFIGDRSEHRSPWTPEAHRTPLPATVGSKTTKAAIKEEMTRSLEAYPAPKTVKDVETMMNEMARTRLEDLVLVWEKRIIVHDSFLNQGDPAMLRDKYRHLKLLHTIISEEDVSNVVYAYSRYATDERVKSRGSCERMIPEFVATKYHGYSQCGLLIPNVLFANPPLVETPRKKSASDRSKQTIEKLDKGWKDRINKVLWRGQSNDVPPDHPAHCTYAHESARIRLQVLSLGRDHPKQIQSHCIIGKPCVFYDQAGACGQKKSNRRLSHTASMKSLAKRNSSLHSKEAINVKNLTKWRYQLNAPHSWRLNLLWMVGSVVMLWDSPYVEWYYPALQHGVTHLAVSYQTAMSVLQELEKYPERAKRLRRNAIKIHQVVFSRESVITYMVNALAAYRKHFKMAKVLEDPASFRRFVRGHFGAWTSRLVEVKFGTMLTMVEIYRDESFNILRKMIAATESADILMFHRSVAGDYLAPTTNWRLHDWRPDNETYSLF